MEKHEIKDPFDWTKGVIDNGGGTGPFGTQSV